MPLHFLSGRGAPACPPGSQQAFLSTPIFTGIEADGRVDWLTSGDTSFLFGQREGILCSVVCLSASLASPKQCREHPSRVVTTQNVSPCWLVSWGRTLLVREGEPQSPASETHSHVRGAACPGVLPVKGRRGFPSSRPPVPCAADLGSLQPVVAGHTGLGGSRCV